VVWHRDNPGTRYQGFEHMRRIADPEHGAAEHIDGFVIPEVGDIDDWKKADEFMTIVEHEHGLPEGSLAMSVIVESGSAELALGKLREEMGQTLEQPPAAVPARRRRGRLHKGHARHHAHR
jgi:hypothetical protein